MMASNNAKSFWNVKESNRLRHDIEIAQLYLDKTGRIMKLGVSATYLMLVPLSIKAEFKPRPIDSDHSGQLFIHLI